ncbi:MAG: hypothetical protein K8T91_22640, partial [Planctomycetes bacterium]|nr:hypothetical protein [Planctomycetota bacterium]
TVLSPPYTATWANVAQGSYSITAVATDATGAQTSSAPTTITVTPAQAALYFIHPDHLGTPRLVTDEANAIVWRHLPTTEPFGNSPPEEDPNATGTRFEMNLAFPGQYRDRESNLSYNYFRDYDSLGGRYRQSDPIGLSGGINPYGYVGGSPISRFDLFGLYSCIYSVPQHYIVCTPDDPTHPSFASSNYVAGNNDQTDASGAPCQNNPRCSNIEDVGPLPSGTYDVGAQKSNSSRRPLTPVFPLDTYGSNRPGGYQTHGCGDTASCSSGCIAATTNATRDKLNQIFGLEKTNTISVQGF